MSETELQALCREWQQILRLEDWDIEVRLTRNHEFPDKYHGGDCHVFVEKQCARIRILPEGDRLPDVMAPYDQEIDLVHEILHVAFKQSQPEIDDASPHWQQHERAIHRVSEALVGLKREKSQR